MILSRLSPVLFLVLLASCATPVEIDPIGPLPLTVETAPDRAASFDRVSPTRTYTGWEEIDLLMPAEAAVPPKAGDVLGNGIVVTETIERFWESGLTKDWKLSERLAPQVLAEIPADNPFREYWVASKRVQHLIHAGQPELARKAIEELSDAELALFGHNVDALSQLGQLATWVDRPDDAIGYLKKVVSAAPGWWPPTFYLSLPSNVEEMRHLAGSKIRALAIMAVAYNAKQDWQNAVRWGDACRQRVHDMIGLTEHWLYGMFLSATTHLYQGYAWCLTHLADARAGLTGDLAAGDPLWERARIFFEAAGYVDRDLVLAEHRDYVGRTVGALPRIGQRIGPVEEQEPTFVFAYSDLIRGRAADATFREAIDLPLPDPGSARLPGAGARSAYEFVVTPELDAATTAYLNGEGNKALTLIDAAESALANRSTEQVGDSEIDRFYRWYLSYFRVQVLIQLGRGADAETALIRSEELERAAFGTNVNARALRGEAKLWQGRAEDAILDFVSVVKALQDWRMPTLFVFWPDVAHNVAMTRAHFRSYLGMAGAMLLTGDHREAEAWAQAAEDLLAEAYYNVHHPLNRQYFFVDPDLYFARGINLGILGAARMVNSGEADAGAPMFESASAYFRALGYDVGQATVEGFRVRSLIEIGRADLAEPAAAKAARFAAENGLADLVWKIEALRGEALLQLGRPDEAEAAYRAADTAVESVTGSLSSDEAKRRFGVGKEQITERLIELDIQRGDMAALFRDLERGRARAFVEMLADRPVASGRQEDLVAAIRDTDAAIRAQRLRNTAPGSQAAKGVAAEQALLAKRASLVAELQRRDPELADFFAVGTQTLASIQARLGPADRISYSLPPEETGALRFLVIGRSSAEVTTAPIAEGRLRTLLAAFEASGRAVERSARSAIRSAGADRWRLDARADSRTRGTPVDPLSTGEQVDAATELQRDLALPAVPDGGTLYMVPRGDLYFMPWGVLETETPVVVLPTGGWLARSPESAGARDPAAVLGDPDLQGALPPLPGAREEAGFVGGLYDVRSLVGPAATEESLRRSVGSGVDVLHLATHGTFDSNAPLESALYLADPGGGGAATLTAAELFDRPLSARLVVLSACETGLGRAEAGDDFLGLARSFYLGGALSVVYSLWPVQDEPTRLFMEAFHEKARQGDYAGGWVHARNRLREAGYPPSVYGVFVLGGAAGG